jgi:hypothetical protein
MMVKPGKALEQLVAVLESVLGPTDVVMTSPDKIAGKLSNQEREVDVSLRARVGSAQILVIIECRDRQGAQDVRWIEELATKREDVGADKAIAVSPTGFSEAARSLATAKIIDLEPSLKLRHRKCFVGSVSGAFQLPPGTLNSRCIGSASERMGYSCPLKYMVP